ncbi:hypothetical protein R1flu_003843 [Riccia fluitans]|uniref:Protein kinase domain-containing protein n=1 Tax=Riccia fluitans TaxID=41844 RepID=A0ABD1YA51_9MARC
MECTITWELGSSRMRRQEQEASRKSFSELTSAGAYMFRAIIMLMVATGKCSTVTRDKDALLFFKGNLSDPGQELASWSDLSDPCHDKWRGVFCSAGLSNRVVEQLSLANLKLTATSIPSSLQNLKDMNSLDLGGNNFAGPIPVWLATLKKLVFISLVNNQLSGEIPAEISLLADTLTNLKITNNSLSGSIPEEIGNLTKLTFFACEANKLSGVLPDSLSNLRTMEHLHMDHNQFVESLPDGLGSLPNLTHIVLNDNLLSGTLPNDLGSSSSLKHLKLDNNEISGQIPPSYGSLGSITDLRLRNNKLVGSIPSSLGNLKTLRVLDLSGNPLQGTIPDFDNLKSIVSLSLADSNLTGTIPGSLSDLDTLEIIDFSNNNLTGSIPSNFGLGGNLLSLQIENNAITGSIPFYLLKRNLDFIAYGNPLCADSDNAATNACRTPDLTQVPVPPTCTCPRGMVFRPFLRERVSPSGCDCVAPLIFQLYFPQVQKDRFTVDQQTRMEANVARELYLEAKQVSVNQPVISFQTGTVVSFSVFPLESQALDYRTVSRIGTKLNAPYPDQMWLDGEFGWFSYKVESFVLPVVSDAYPPFPPRDPGQDGSNKSSVTQAIWISAMVGGILILIIACLSIFFYCRREKHKNRFHHSDFAVPYIQGMVSNTAAASPGSTVGSPAVLQRTNAVLHSFGPPVKIFTYEELAEATGDFGPDGIIGSGGFGSVYKGQLADGTLVAVKRLTKKKSLQGEAEFRTEVEMIAHQLHSPHLVRLRGYCSQGDERLLVYDLMGRGSVFDYLRDYTRPSPVALLDWKTRIQIARDAAAGIRFLHETSPPVVHRDIKPSNILLDDQLNAKVADFGLSKSFPLPQSDHVTTRVVGTFGYLAPDYSITGKLTVKSDVYSFGVVLLEILSGKHSTVADETEDEKPEQFLVPWAKPLLNDKHRVYEVVDPALHGAYPPKGVLKLGALISSCLQLDPDRRPDMALVHSTLCTIHEIPVLTPKAREQREALVASTYVFRSRSTSSIHSSAQRTESSTGVVMPGPGPITPSAGSSASNSSIKLSSASGISFSSMLASRSMSDIFSDLMLSEASTPVNLSDRHPTDKPESFAEKRNWSAENLNERQPGNLVKLNVRLSRSEDFSDWLPRPSLKLEGHTNIEPKDRRSTSKLSFSSSGRHEDSPGRNDHPKRVVHDSSDPR